MIVGPGDAGQVEEVAGAGDRHVDQPGLGWIQRALLAVVVSVRRDEAGADADTGPFPALRLVRGGHGHLGGVLVGQPVDGADNRVRAVVIDQLDDRAQVLPGLVVLGVVLDLAPAGEQEQLRVAGTAPCLEVEGGLGDRAQRAAAAGNRDRNALIQVFQDFSHDIRIAPA